MQYYTYNNKKIPYELTRKKVKNINIHIKGDMVLHISANKNVSIKHIEDLIHKNGEKILLAFSKIEKSKAETAENENKYYLFGKPYNINIIEIKSEKPKIVLDDENMNIYLNKTTSKEKLIDKFEKVLAIKEFEEMSKMVYNQTRAENFPFPIIKVKKLKACYGICHYKSGYITMNMELLHLPKKCLEYVMLHEYCHFAVPNHSVEFYNLVGKYMPNYMEIKNSLPKRKY